MFLRNDFMTLRALEPEDLEIMYRWENDSCAMDVWQHYGTLFAVHNKAIHCQLRQNHLRKKTAAADD